MTAKRLLSLDAFRGATIAGMILVNNSGGSPTYAPLLHAKWHGWTPTDLVFPFFLWITGVSMTYSFASRVERGANRGTLLLHALRRAALIFLTGLFLNAFPDFDFANLRIPGVLQRIAVCYLIAAAIYLFTNAWGRIAAIIGLLALYTLFMHPLGYEVGTNFAAKVDAMFLSGHMYSQTKTWDPEGIWSTLPSIATTLFGILAGEAVRSGRAKWLAAGVLLVAAGQLADPWQPINKSLWTGSYALFTAGLASLGFGIFYWIIDVRGSKAWAKPLVIYGMNAMAAYFLSSFLADIFSLFRWKQALMQSVFLPIASPINASLLYALSFDALIFFFVWIMYRRNWFVRF